VLTLPPRSLQEEKQAETWFQQTQGLLRQTGAQRLLLDLEHVGQIYGGALGKVLRLYKDVNVAGGVLALCGLCQPLLDVMQITKMDRVLKVYANRAKALAELVEAR
jgi:anti-anti-sigma factor